MNATSQPKPRRRSCQVTPRTVLVGLLVFSGCGPSTEQQAMRADVYTELGDFDRVFADYDEAIAIQPESAMARNDRGFASYQKGELNPASVLSERR